MLVSFAQHLVYRTLTPVLVNSEFCSGTQACTRQLQTWAVSIQEMCTQNEIKFACKVRATLLSKPLLSVIPLDLGTWCTCTSFPYGKHDSGWLKWIQANIFKNKILFIHSRSSVTGSKGIKWKQTKSHGLTYMNISFFFSFLSSLFLPPCKILLIDSALSAPS